MDRPGFDDIIKLACCLFSFTGLPYILLIEKLKHIKSALKLWLKDIKINEEETFTSLSNDIQNLDKILETRELHEEEHWIYSECKIGILELEDLRNKDSQQRSRVKWASYGYDNSSYFHRSIKNLESRSRIHGLTINNIWVTKLSLVKKEARSFFAKRFKCSSDPIPNLSCYNIK
ncbi:hypothetical protein QVD17_24285 [Tagetes erecta]|uniref:RNA-directed DNA polymerase, eukaryota, reverse transcriptase zinc-binding domain protein n=1 Tax=Tagetes erecta TaxID=13708 RepID=A0AAD8KK07_TARER|nr:hypothetical protein QVD17_24285 [Tagetes erecta]